MVLTVRVLNHFILLTSTVMEMNIMFNIQQHSCYYEDACVEHPCIIDSVILLKL